MESPSEQGKPQPERVHVRPPGLEMGNGLAIFSLVFMVFAGAQFVAMIMRIRATTPQLSGAGFSDLKNNDLFAARWKELSENGDAISWVGLASGLAGLVLLLGLVRWWKGPRIVQFLALRLPAWRPFLAWCGFFVLVYAALEGIAYLLPEGSESEFVAHVLGSITNRGMFVLGVALLPALFEELLFRGLLYGSLRHLLDKHSAIAISAGIFTFIHLQYEWYLLLLNVLPLGIFLGYARANSGSIWTCVFLHFVNNAAGLYLP